MREVILQSWPNVFRTTNKIPPRVQVFFRVGNRCVIFSLPNPQTNVCGLGSCLWRCLLYCGLIAWIKADIVLRVGWGRQGKNNFSAARWIDEPRAYCVYNSLIFKLEADIIPLDGLYNRIHKLKEQCSFSVLIVNLRVRFNASQWNLWDEILRFQIWIRIGSWRSCCQFFLVYFLSWLSFLFVSGGDSQLSKGLSSADVVTVVIKTQAHQGKRGLFKQRRLVRLSATKRITALLNTSMLGQ